MKNEKRQFVVLATIGCRFLVNVLSPKLLLLFSQRGKIAENNKNVQRMKLNSKGLFSRKEKISNSYFF